MPHFTQNSHIVIQKSDTNHTTVTNKSTKTSPRSHQQVSKRQPKITQMPPTNQPTINPKSHKVTQKSHPTITNKSSQRSPDGHSKVTQKLPRSHHQVTKNHMNVSQKHPKHPEHPEAPKSTHKAPKSIRRPIPLLKHWHLIRTTRHTIRQHAHRCQQVVLCKSVFVSRWFH